MDALWPAWPAVILLAWFGWRVACKAGYSGFWGLTALVPPIGLLALWYLAATKDWPGKQTRPEKVDEKNEAGLTIRRPQSAARQDSN